MCVSGDRRDTDTDTDTDTDMYEYIHILHTYKRSRAIEEPSQLRPRTPWANA